ncbi:MAG: DinB family protein [Bacteroidota bacterium]
MKRTRFVKNMFSLSLIALFGCQTENREKALPGKGIASFTGRETTATLRKELTAAWLQSEKMTLTNVNQMPPEFFKFKYADGAMTFSEQWRHCVIYTCGQLASRTSLENPYHGIKLPVQMPKTAVIRELKTMYAFVRRSIETLSDENLLSNCDFLGESIPVWRLFYAMENHIIHHRGQCIVYLRLNGIVPKGYYGW